MTQNLISESEDCVETSVCVVCLLTSHHANQGAPICTAVLPCWCISSSRGFRWRWANACVTYCHGKALSLQLGTQHCPRRSWLSVTGVGGGRREGGGGRGGCGDRMGADWFSHPGSTLEVWHYTCCCDHHRGIVCWRRHWFLTQICKSGKYGKENRVRDKIRTRGSGRQENK